MHTKIAIVVICLMLSCVHASPVDQNHHNGEQADTRLGYGVRQRSTWMSHRIWLKKTTGIKEALAEVIMIQCSRDRLSV